MREHESIEKIAALATELGWETPDACDHVDYFGQVVLGMKVLSIALTGSGKRGDRWRPFVLQRQAERLDYHGRIGGRLSLDRPDMTFQRYVDLMNVAPSRWAAEICLLASGHKNMGRAWRVVDSCYLIQDAMRRHNRAPEQIFADEARGTRAGDAPYTRLLYLISPREKIFERRECDRFFVVGWKPDWASGAERAGVGGDRRGASAPVDDPDTRSAREDDGGWNE